MKPVPVVRFRKNPSAYLASVQAGLSFLLVRSGKIITRVEQYKAKGDWQLHRAELIARGITREPKKLSRSRLSRQSDGHSPAMGRHRVGPEKLVPEALERRPQLVKIKNGSPGRVAWLNS